MIDWLVICNKCTLKHTFYNNIINTRKTTLSLGLLYLCVFAEYFGVETDPVVRDKHSTLVEDVFLQGTGVTWQMDK